MAPPDDIWTRALLAPPDDARFTYTTGEAFSPSARYGESKLRLWKDGSFRLDNRIRLQRRAWGGQVDDEAFPALWSALRAAGFPTPPDVPIPPGGARVLVVWALGEVKALAFPRGDVDEAPAWGLIGAVCDSLIAQIAPDIAFSHTNRMEDSVVERHDLHTLAPTIDKDLPTLRSRWAGDARCHDAVLEAIRTHQPWNRFVVRLPRAKEVKEFRDLRGYRFGMVELPRAKLAGACARDADLRYVRMPEGDLRGASLVDADLSAAHLQKANLRDADLRGANLADAYLQGADLTGADLRDAEFRGAHLEGAVLDKTRRTGARFDPEVPRD